MIHAEGSDLNLGHPGWIAGDDVLPDPAGAPRGITRHWLHNLSLCFNRPPSALLGGAHAPGFASRSRPDEAPRRGPCSQIASCAVQEGLPAAGHRPCASRMRVGWDEGSVQWDRRGPWPRCRRCAYLLWSRMCAACPLAPLPPPSPPSVLSHRAGKESGVGDGDGGGGGSGGGGADILKKNHFSLRPRGRPVSCPPPSSSPSRALSFRLVEPTTLLLRSHSFLRIHILFFFFCGRAAFIPYQTLLIPISFHTQAAPPLR